jgi:hypothetical protein
VIVTITGTYGRNIQLEIVCKSQELLMGVLSSACNLQLQNLMSIHPCDQHTYIKITSVFDTSHIFINYFTVTDV